MKLIWLYSFFLTFSFGFAYSQNLVGFVLDSNTKVPLLGATIRLEGTNYGTLTNKEGKFSLTNLKKGRYSLIVSYVGYYTKRIGISIPSKDTMTIFLVPRPIQTSELIVSATKKLQTVQEVPVSISFVPSDFYQQRNYIRLDEALRFVSGVIVNKDNINIRGSSGFSFGLGSRVAYLIDGQPMLSGDNADAKYDIIPVDVINNIEIVKGAGSSLYGSSAIGGVLNITTKEPSDTFSYSLRFQSGIYTKPKYEQWIYTNNLTTKSTFSGYLSGNLNFIKFLTGLNFVNDESYRLFDKSQRYNLFAKVSKDLKNYGKLTLFGFHSSDKKNDWVYWNSLDSATRPPTGTDLSRYLVSDKSNLSLEHRFIFAGNMFSNFRAALFYTNLDNKLQSSSAEFRKSQSYSFNSELQFNNHFRDNTLLTYGVGFTRNWVVSNIYGRHKQNLTSIYSQIELQRFFNAILTLGGRVDFEKSDSSKMYIEFSPKFGLNLNIGQNKSIRLSIGRGFRSPALAERFATIKYGGFEVVPNYDLKSEFCWSSEIGCLLEFPDFIFPSLIDFSLFYSKYDELIEPNFAINEKPVIRFENISRARIVGLEASFKTLLINFIPFSVGFTFLEPRDLKDNKFLKYRSRYNLVSSVSIPYKFVTTNIDFRYISKIERLDEILKYLMEDYDAIVPVYVLDLSVNFDLSSFKLPLSFTISAQNLFDYYYVEMVGNLAPTRLISLRIQYKH